MRSTGSLTMVSIMLLVLFAVMALGSAGESDVDRGGEETANTEGEEREEDQGEIRYEVNENYEIMGLEIIVGEIVFEKDKVLVGMTLTNTQDKSLEFYPDQGDLVAGDLQLTPNFLMSEGDLGGTIQGGVTKSGVIHFTAPEDRQVPEVSEIGLHLGNVSDLDGMEFVEFSEVIVLE